MSWAKVNDIKPRRTLLRLDSVPPGHVMTKGGDGLTHTHTPTLKEYSTFVKLGFYSQREKEKEDEARRKKDSLISQGYRHRKQIRPNERNVLISVCCLVLRWWELIMNNLMRSTIQTGSDRIWIKETYDATYPPTSLSEHNFDVAFFVVWCYMV